MDFCFAGARQCGLLDRFAMSASTWWIFALRVHGRLSVESEDERNSGADICQAELGGEWRIILAYPI